jgi:methanogenic corrinoid protein MtbC1/DNA-binding XRE family transcriptional regulator
MNQFGRDVPPPQELREKYLDTLLRRDAAAASAVTDEASQQGWSAARLYLEILGWAQERIGELWHSGRINVAQEHLATQITLNQMERLRQRSSPRTRWGIKAAVACIEGNLHDLGARILADLFILDGLEVEFLGASTPNHDLVEYVRQWHPRLVALSVALEEHIVPASRAVTELRNLPDPPKILIGGHIVAQDIDAVQALEVDGVAMDAVKAIREAHRLLGLSREPLTLNDYLTLLGQRVQKLRRQRMWSQEQLAQRADLDRTYISALEHGKQNLTLGAVVRLADALEVPLGKLLAEGQNCP